MEYTSSVVLFCIIRRTREKDNETEYLLMPKIAYKPSFLDRLVDNALDVWMETQFRKEEPKPI